MKKQLHVVLFLALLTGPTSCDFLSPSLETTWHITKIEPATHDTESELVYTDAFLSFYKNGTASFFNKDERNESRKHPVYRVGQWEKDGDELKLNLKHTMINVGFNIIELSKKWLVLEIVHGPKNIIGTVLKCQPSELYRSQSFDLLDPANNAWRTKPQHKENLNEIKRRTAAHIGFLIGYFNMVEEKAQGYFETSILQTPFQFFSNGMALPDEFEAGDVWLSNFYDEADAARGGTMLSRGLTSIEAYPSDDKSYTKGYYNALLLIKEHIEK